MLFFSLSGFLIQRLMMPHFRSRTEHIIPMCNILVLLLYTNFTQNVAFMAQFNAIQQGGGYFFWATLYCMIHLLHYSFVRKSYFSIVSDKMLCICFAAALPQSILCRICSAVVTAVCYLACILTLPISACFVLKVLASHTCGFLQRTCVRHVEQKAYTDIFVLCY